MRPKQLSEPSLPRRCPPPPLRTLRSPPTGYTTYRIYAIPCTRLTDDAFLPHNAAVRFCFPPKRDGYTSKYVISGRAQMD